jgi:hypothetical protein
MAFGLVRAYLVLVLDSPISAITKSSNAGLFWGVDATIEYGGANVSVNLSNNTSGIIDSGSTLIHISTSELLRDSTLPPDMRPQTHITLLR